MPTWLRIMCKTAKLMAAALERWAAGQATAPGELVVERLDVVSKLHSSPLVWGALECERLRASSDVVRQALRPAGGVKSSVARMIGGRAFASGPLPAPVACRFMSVS
jgi:hypothetical protein